MPGSKSPPSIMKSTSTSDIELLRFGDDGPAAGAGGAASSGFGSGKRRWMRDVAESFRPIHHDGMRYPSIDATSPWPGTRFYNLKSATLDAASPNLATKLKGRHLQMIAFGGSIGMFSLIHRTVLPVSASHSDNLQAPACL